MMATVAGAKYFERDKEMQHTHSIAVNYTKARWITAIKTREKDVSFRSRYPPSRL